jgi:hypothetical protein
MRAARRRWKAPRAVSVRATVGRHAERGRGPIGRGLCARAQQPPARDFVARREREPRGEVLLGGPAAHVGANFRDQREGRLWRDAVDLGEVDAPGERVEGRPNLEPGLVAARGPFDTRRRHGRRGGEAPGRQGLQVRLNGTVARTELHLTGLVEREILLKHEQVFRSIVAGQGLFNGGAGRAAAMVTVRGEVMRVAAPREDVAQNPQPRRAHDVTDHEAQLQVHLQQRFLHTLHVRARARN